ncbi:transmembrane protein 276 [Haemorhous mexicanus]|uniref:transmembrane protein 276 n=1 Tax=Haemorhous mexicanus TaxID=30427 RepID=UPI0028BE08A2|nr:transmembrane protein 276 [Haemorhous mexicanus]
MHIYGLLAPPSRALSQSERSATPPGPRALRARGRCRKWRSPGVSPGAMGDTGVALSHALLCVTSLGCALRARQVTPGPAAGFLLQALVAASTALSPPRPLDVPEVPPPSPPPSWICSVLSQPLVAFGCHRLSGDSATAAVLLASGTAVAALAAGWPRFVTAGHFVPAGHFVTALTAASLLALAALTGSVTGAVAAALVALGDAVAPGVVPWVRVAASVALLGTLREQEVALRGQR